MPPVAPELHDAFGATLRRALQTPAPAPGAALPYCGLGDVGCNGKSPSCACVDYLFECDPTGGTCSPMTVGMAVLVVGALVLLWLCCSKEDEGEGGYEPISSSSGGRDRGGGKSKSKSKKDKGGKSKSKKSKKQKTAYIDDR